MSFSPCWSSELHEGVYDQSLSKFSFVTCSCSTVSKSHKLIFERLITGVIYNSKGAHEASTGLPKGAADVVITLALPVLFWPAYVVPVIEKQMWCS